MIDEDQQLDEAMRRGDDLLHDSLKHDDRRRSRRKLTIAATALAVACVFATATWFLRHRRSAANIEPIQQINQPAETKNSYSAELLALTDDWRAAYSVGQRLANADPDA